MKYDPDSIDSTLSRILQRLDEQDRAAAAWREEQTRTAAETLKEVKRTNGRVTKLENDRWFNRGVVATVGIIASAAWQWVLK